MIVIDLKRAPFPEGGEADPTLIDPNNPPLVEADDRHAVWGVSLRLPDVTLTITQRRGEDDKWAFYVTSSAETTIERFGPEGSGAPR